MARNFVFVLTLWLQQLWEWIGTMAIKARGGSLAPTSVRAAPPRKAMHKLAMQRKKRTSIPRKASQGVARSSWK